ncbi:MAG: hypothetical protein AAFN07_14710 [Pseudomonadota bacterium]
MRSINVFQRCVAILLAFVGVNALADELLPYPARYTDRQLAGDLGMVEGALREMHPDLERGASYEAFENAVRFASGELKKTSTETGFLVALSRMIVLIGNGHTEIRLSEAAERFYDRQPMYLGLRFRHTDEHTNILHDYYADGDALVGREVASINGTPFDRIRSLMSGFVSGDGDIQTGRVIVLIDGSTDAVASDLASRLHQERAIMILGEESAGAYHGKTSMVRQTLVLPRTKMRITIPLERFDASYSYVAKIGRGVMPDEIVVPTGVDIVSHRDHVMEHAMALAQAPEEAD